MAELILLSGLGHHRPQYLSRKRRRRAHLPGIVQYPAYHTDETMDGLLRDLQRVGEGITRVVTAPFKAIGHIGGEAGRGISTGDWSRVFQSPIRGIGHYAGETSRGSETFVKASGTLYYNQSCTLSAVGSAGSMIPGPQQPFVAGATAISGAVCGFKQRTEEQRAQEKYNRELQEYYEKVQAGIPAQNPAKPGNTGLYLALGAVAIGAGVLFLT